MAEYPLHLVRQRRLADGRSVVIRPVRADDAAAEREFFAGLSEAAKRLRFPKGPGEPDEQLLEFFTRIDYDRHMAFVCEAPQDGRNALVGEARYLANPDGRSCEFGIVIADDWHHSGIAQLLMGALIRAARSRGFETMAGLVSNENRDMLRFVNTLGFEARVEPLEPASVRVALKL